MKISTQIFINAENSVIWEDRRTLWGIEPLIKSYQTVNQFFSLKTGDVVVLNDPQCGGLFPWALTLLRKYKTGTLIQLIPISMPWQNSDKIDQECLRIPPTPLVIEQQIQQAIISALSAHPWMEFEFESKIQAHIKSLESLNFDLLKASNTDVRALLKNFLHELPHWETQSEIHLSSQEILKLKLHISENGITCDFTGTSVGHQVFMSETLVSGLCHEYLFQILQAPADLWALFSSVISIKRPQNCFLNSKFPQGQLHGLARGSGALWQCLQQAMVHLKAKENMAMHLFFPLWLQVESSDQCYNLILPAGTGSDQQHPGQPVFALDGLSCLPNTTDLLKNFDIDFLGLNPRQDPTENSPGAGLQIKLTAQSPVKIKWIYEDHPSLLKTTKNHTAMTGHEIWINEVKQKNFGSENLAPGDQLKLITGHGAGLINTLNIF